MGTVAQKKNEPPKKKMGVPRPSQTHQRAALPHFEAGGQAAPF
jgi:hypothetical protein